MMIKQVLILIMIAAVASFIGFCVENIFISMKHGFMDNRNMILPLLFGYGLSMIAYYVLFGTPDAPLFFCREISFNTTWESMLYSFIVAFLGVSIGEILLGYATQYSCGIIWWDYTSIPLHITRYTSVPTSAGFAFLIMLFMKYCFPALYSTFSRMNPRALATVSLFFLVAMSLDMINSTIYMFKNHNLQTIWRIDFKKPLLELILHPNN